MSMCSAHALPSQASEGPTRQQDAPAQVLGTGPRLAQACRDAHHLPLDKRHLQRGLDSPSAEPVAPEQERQEAPRRCLGVMGTNAGGRVANVAHRRAGHPPFRRVALNVLFEPQDAHLCKLRRHKRGQAPELQRLNAAEEAADHSVAGMLVDSDVAPDRDLHGGGQ